MAASQGTARVYPQLNVRQDYGLYRLQAVTSALFQREKTGEGQHVDLSMLDAGLFFLFPDAYMNHTLLDDDAEAQPVGGCDVPTDGNEGRCHYDVCGDRCAASRRGQGGEYGASDV